MLNEAHQKTSEKLSPTSYHPTKYVSHHHQYPKKLKKSRSLCSWRRHKIWNLASPTTTFEFLCMMMTMKTKHRENKFANFLQHKHNKAALSLQTMSMLTARAWTAKVCMSSGVRLEPRFSDSRYAIIFEWYMDGIMPTLVLEFFFCPNQFSRLDFFGLPQMHFPCEWGVKSDRLCPESFLSCAQSNFHIHNWMLLLLPRSTVEN